MLRVIALLGLLFSVATAQFICAEFFADPNCNTLVQRRVQANSSCNFVNDLKLGNVSESFSTYESPPTNTPFIIRTTCDTPTANCSTVLVPGLVGSTLCISGSSGPNATCFGESLGGLPKAPYYPGQRFTFVDSIDKCPNTTIGFPPSPTPGPPALPAPFACFETFSDQFCQNLVQRRASAVSTCNIVNDAVYGIVSEQITIQPTFLFLIGTLPTPTRTVCRPAVPTCQGFCPQSPLQNGTCTRISDAFTTLTLYPSQKLTLIDNLANCPTVGASSTASSSPLASIPIFFKKRKLY